MNIQDLLKQLHIPFRLPGQHHHASHGWAQVDCPFCSPGSGKFRLGINLSKGYCSCWSCGGRRLAYVLQEITGRSVGECYDLLRDVGWKPLATVRTKAKGLKVPRGVGPLLPQHIDYLEERGFNIPQVIQLWGVGGIGLAHRLKWRLWLPIVSEGVMVSWTTRSIVPDATVRYISAHSNEETIHHRTLLYGADYARHSIVVVEGPLDAWAIGPGAVATLGLVYSRQQLLAMSKYARRVICFDNEPGAQRRATHLADELLPFPGETCLYRLQSGKDAAEADQQEIARIRSLYLGDGTIQKPL